MEQEAHQEYQLDQVLQRGIQVGQVYQVEIVQFVLVVGLQVGQWWAEQLVETEEGNYQEGNQQEELVGKVD